MAAWLTDLTVKMERSGQIQGVKFLPSLKQVNGNDALQGGGGRDIVPNVLQTQIIVSHFLLENHHLSFIFFT